jgi:hypothetical protein
MHKSIPIAVITLLLIASPLMMFGTFDSNIFSKAMAIEEDGSESDIIMKSNAVEEKDESSDEAKDDDDDDSSDEAKDDDDDDSSDEAKDDDDDDSSDEEKDNDESSATTNNFQGQAVQSTANTLQSKCDKGIEYWALAIKFLADEQGITISDAYKQFAKYFIAAIPDPSNSQESQAAIGLMDCLKERAISLLSTENSQPNAENTSLQNQNNVSQMKQVSKQSSSSQQNLIGQEQMQRQQNEEPQILPLPVAQNQKNESQIKEASQQPTVKSSSQPVVQNQKDESQTTERSQKDNVQLSIVTQEDMQQQQYDKFKELMASIKQQHKNIEIIK